MSKPKHIVLICSRLDLPGGAEKAVVSLAGLLAEKGHRVTLLVLDIYKGSFYPVSSSVTVQYENMRFGLAAEKNWFARKLDFIKDVQRIRRLWTLLKPDTVIATDYPYVVACVLSGATRVANCWSWEHHAFGWLKKSVMWERLLAYAYKRMQGVICVNKAETKHFRALNSNVKVIPNFVSVSSGKLSSLEEKNILTIGWLIHRKGIDLLLPAAKRVFAKHPDWKWKIIGTGEKEPEVRKFIAENHLEQTLLLQPPIGNDLASEYQQSAVFVLPSRIEVFGLVLVEAMSYGLPCVALAKADGPAGIIKNEQDGLLVSEDAEQLADAIIRLIENKALRKKFGSNAAQNVQRFAPGIVYKEWEKIL